MCDTHIQGLREPIFMQTKQRTGYLAHEEERSQCYVCYHINDYKIGHCLSPLKSFFAVILSPVGYHNEFTCIQIITSVSFYCLPSIEVVITLLASDDFFILTVR